MAQIVHSTQNEVVDSIIKTINPHQERPFGELWGPAFKYGAGKDNNPSYQLLMLRKHLHFMVENNLLSIGHGVNLGESDWNTPVMLTIPGNTIREDGGWFKYLERNSEIAKLQLENARSESRRFKINVILGVAAIIATVFGGVQTRKIDKLEERLSTLTTEKESLSNQLTARDGLLETKAEEIQSKTLKIDSLAKALHAEKVKNIPKKKR